MAGEWKVRHLSEIYEFSSGLSKPRSEFGFGHGFLTFKDVLENYFVPDELSALVNSTEKDRATCSILRGDVFLTRTSETQHELGMSCVALKDYPFATFNGFTKRLRPNSSNDVVPEYAAYFFRSPRFRRDVTSMSSLSTRASLNNEMLSRLSIDLPPINEQKAIGILLKSLDDKIELNRRRNRTLEAMARSIFESWFVDFDPVKSKAAGRSPSGLKAELARLFPSAFSDTSIGSIPSGWHVAKLNDICRIGRGSSPRPIHNYMGGSVPWIKIADATAAGGPFIYQTKEFVTDAGAEKSVWVNPGDLILSNSATCGVPIFVGLRGCIHDGWLHFSELKRISRGYLYHWLITIAEHLIRIADGSVQKNLNTALVGSQILAVPTPELVSAFDRFNDEAYRKIDKSIQESRTLTELRDTLLPKLVSGTLRVPDAERIVGRVI